MGLSEKGNGGGVAGSIALMYVYAWGGGSCHRWKDQPIILQLGGSQAVQGRFQYFNWESSLKFLVFLFISDF